MRHYKFEDWCHNAVSGIGFPPDRDQVYWELYGHMEDHYDTLRAQGIEPGDAEKQVYDAMGDAFAVGKDLARIHRPFWGYFLRGSRIVLVIILVLTLIPVVEFLWENRDPRIGPDHGYDIYNADNYGGDTGRTLLMLTDPDITFRDSGYTFRVSDAVVWSDVYEGEERAFLYLRMKVFNPRLWAFFPDWMDDPLYELYATDSLGNYYKTMNERIDPEEFYVCVRSGQTGPLTAEYTIWINRLQLENDWIEFVYDRDGRDHTIRIHLPGGEAQ